MAFWNDVSRFAGNLTGGLVGESDEERKKKEALKAEARRKAQVQSQPQPKPQYTPSVQAAIRQRDEEAQKAKNDIWNPAKIAEDIGGAIGKAGKAAVDMGKSTFDGAVNLTIDTANAGATVAGEINGQNARNEATIKAQADEKKRMAESFAQRARTARTQEDFDKYANMARSLATGASDDEDRITNLRNEGLANTDPMKTVSNAGTTILDLATLGKGKTILEGVKLGTKVTLPVLKEFAKNTGITALQTGGIGGAYGGLSTMQDPAATVEEYLTNIGMGTALGAGLGVGAQVALPVAGAAARTAAKATNNAAIRSANYGLLPPTNLTKTELEVAARVRQAQEGYISPNDLSIDDMITYQGVQEKLGAKPGTPEAEMAVVDALGAHRNFETERTIRKENTVDALEKSSEFAREHLMPAGSIKGVDSIATEMTPPKGEPTIPDNRATNNLGLDNLDARERFGQGRNLDPTNPETQRALIEQEINARIAQLPDDTFIQQMGARFGVSEPALRRLMAQTSKNDLFRKLNDSADFVRTANNPDAAATSIINKATEAGRAAAARAGVTVTELSKAEPIPIMDGKGPHAAPERVTTIDSQGNTVDVNTGEIIDNPAPKTEEQISTKDSPEVAARKLEISKEIAMLDRELQSFRPGTASYVSTRNRIGYLAEELDSLNGSNTSAADEAMIQKQILREEATRKNQEYANQATPQEERQIAEMLKRTDPTTSEPIPVTAKYVAEQTTALPDSKNAKGADIPRIKDTQNITLEHVNNFEAATTPEQRASLMREVSEHERSGAPLSDESKALYDEWIRPVVESLYSKSRKAGKMGQKGYYLPEELTGTEARPVKKYGNEWADEANMDFGHSMTRENKIDTNDLNDPTVSLKNYVQQHYQDNYGHLTPENIAEAEGRGAVDGAAYVTGRRNVAEKLDESMVRSIGDKKDGVSNKERVNNTLKIAEDLRANADATLHPESIETFQGGLSGTRLIRTNRKIAARIEAGNGKSAYERFGMRQFENAESLGNDAFEQNFTDGMTREEYSAGLHGYYDSIYQRELTDVMSPERFHEIVEGGVSRSYKAKSGTPLARVEQSLAIEKAIYASEHIRYTDKATQKYIDYEVGHLLRRGKMPSTIARSIANNLSRTLYSGALGLNPLSAIQNFTELARVAGLTAGKDTLKTLEAQVKGATPKQISDTFKSYGIDSNRIRQEMTDALPAKKKAIRLFGKARDAIEDTVMAGFNFSEATKNYAMIKALEIKHADIADPRLRREAIMDDFNANSLIGGHYGNLLGVDRSNALRVAMQFGTYTLRDWGQLAEHAKTGDMGYVARTLGTKAALAAPMYALFGTTLAYTLGINEFKGGPAVSLTTELINSIVDENARVESEVEAGRKAEFDWNNVKSQFSKKATPLMIPGGNFAFNKLGVQDLTGFDKDNKVFREDTFVAGQQKGYNANKAGQPRFTSADTPQSFMRGLIGGAYNTDEAREYFGKSFWANPKLFGLFDTNTQRHSPAYGRFQDKIEGQSAILTDPKATPEAKQKARATIRDTFDKAYESQDLKKAFFKENPDASGIYKEMTKTTFNKATGKRESDVISPERWRYVESEKSGKLFNFLKERAIKNNEYFGDPIDPIYTEDLTEVQRREVLNLRSSYTGDDKERKSMLYESDWYPDFADKMQAYYKEMEKQTVAEDSDYGKTKRAQEYIKLSGEMPQQDPLYKQYIAIRYGDRATGKKGDEALGKQFYKNNADALNAAREKHDKESLDWINKMRTLEGVEKLTLDQYTNDSYGYKSGGGSKSYGGKAESTRTGANDTITNFGSKATGPIKLKLKQNELIDVRNVVKQPRATKKANIRITI